MPIFLFYTAYGLWLKFIRQKFVQKTEWVLLEIIPPAEVKKTPRAMEQFFAGLHGTQSGPNWKEINIQGSVQRWFSLEIVSQSGEIHFLVRAPAIFRNLVEAQIYAQYPEAEINEVDDYIYSVPSDIPSEDYDLWGTELVLTKEDAYPIRTYTAFEKDVVLEEQRIDPLASLLEVMSKLRQGENIWIQTLIRPVRDDWKKEAEKLRDQILGRVEKKSPGIFSQEVSALTEETRKNISHLITGVPGAGDEKKEEKKSNPLDLMTKGEKDAITAIEENISKIGFEVIIRFLYLAPTDIFSRANVAAVMGCYKQFSTQNLNGFKPNLKITTMIDYEIQGKHKREAYRKKKVFEDYKKRDFVLQSNVIKYLKPAFFEKWPILNWFFVRSQPFVFNIEELATIYHLPGMMVKAPLSPKVEAKKGEPPARLPTS